MADSNRSYRGRYAFKLACLESGKCTHACKQGQSCRRLPSEFTDWELLKNRLGNRARRLERDCNTHGLHAAGELLHKAIRAIEGGLT